MFNKLLAGNDSVCLMAGKPKPFPVNDAALISFTIHDEVFTKARGIETRLYSGQCMYPQATYVIYRDDTLFHDPHLGNTTALASNVILVQVGTDDIRNLTHRVRGRFQVNRALHGAQVRELSAEDTCSFHLYLIHNNYSVLGVTFPTYGAILYTSPVVNAINPFFLRCSLLSHVTHDIIIVEYILNQRVPRPQLQTF